jgi:predicted P-loop ATPase/GTPase
MPFVSFGYYVAPEDIEKLMEPLRSVADGRNDLLNPPAKLLKEEEEFLNQWRQKERYERSGDNAVVAMVKTRALKVIDALLNLTYTVRLQVRLSVTPFFISLFTDDCL